MKSRTINCLILLFAVALSGCTHTRANHYDTGDNQPPIVKELSKNTKSWDGASLPAYPEGQPEVTILHITIPPGTKLPLHHHPVINAGLLLEGKLTVVVPDGRTLQLEAGDPIIELVDTPHYGMNESDKPAVILVVYAGIEGKPITVLNK
jgi:quercetin dioxygenase-like cupin family protein